jgi:hypothetical protein
MGEAVDVLQLADGDLGVDLRRVQVGVAEHLLDEADVPDVGRD